MMARTKAASLVAVQAGEARRGYENIDVTTRTNFRRQVLKERKKILTLTRHALCSIKQIATEMPLEFSN